MVAWIVTRNQWWIPIKDAQPAKNLSFQITSYRKYPMNLHETKKKTSLWHHSPIVPNKVGPQSPSRRPSDPFAGLSIPGISQENIFKTMLNLKQLNQETTGTNPKQPTKSLNTRRFGTFHKTLSFGVCGLRLLLWPFAHLPQVPTWSQKMVTEIHKHNDRHEMSKLVNMLWHFLAMISSVASSCFICSSGFKPCEYVSSWKLAGKITMFETTTIKKVVVLIISHMLHLPTFSLNLWQM